MQSQCVILKLKSLIDKTDENTKYYNKRRTANGQRDYRSTYRYKINLS